MKKQITNKDFSNLVKDLPNINSFKLFVECYDDDGEQYDAYSTVFNYDDFFGYESLIPLDERIDEFWDNLTNEEENKIFLVTET